TEQFKPRCRQLAAQEVDPCQIAAWPREAMDEAEPDGVVTCDEHDRDCRRCGLGRECRWVTSRRGDYGNPSANQIGRKLRQPVVLSLRPAVFDRDVLALH